MHRGVCETGASRIFYFDLQRLLVGVSLGEERELVALDRYSSVSRMLSIQSRWAVRDPSAEPITVTRFLLTNRPFRQSLVALSQVVAKAL